MECMENWRQFFRGAGTDICSVIEYAILVATTDFPNEFKRKRGRIAQRLYASTFLRCCDCDSVTLVEPHDEINDDEDAQEGIKGCHDEDNDKVNIVTSETNGNRINNYSSDEVEALTEETEEEPQVLKVLKLRNILANPDESTTQLYECLRRLELMELTVETLEATKIGRFVNAFRKHNSKRIQSTVKRLISGWKYLVDGWLKTTSNVAEAAIANSVSPATADNENGLRATQFHGLLTPPFDEGAFLATQMTPIRISQIFDGIDDDGNIDPHVAENIKNNDEYCNHYDVDENQCTVQRPNTIKQSTQQTNLTRIDSPCGEQETSKEREELNRNAEIQDVRDIQGNRMSSSRHINASSGQERSPISSEHKGHQENVQQHPDVNSNQTKPDSLPPQNQKSESPDDASVKMMVEAAKKRLQEGYQLVEKAKKQRMVQVVNLQDIHKKSAKLFRGRPVSQHRRQWMNNWRK